MNLDNKIIKNIIWNIWGIPNKKYPEDGINVFVIWSDHKCESHMCIGYWDEEEESFIFTSTKFCCQYVHTSSEIDEINSWANLPNYEEVIQEIFKQD